MPIALLVLLPARIANAQVVVSPTPPATRALCVDASGNVVFDGGVLGTCATTGAGLTGVTVGTGTSTTTIDGTGVTLGADATLTAGGNATVGGTLGVTGNTMLSTLSTSGAAMLDSLGVTNDATVGGTLGVTGNTTLSTLSTSGAAMLDSLGVTNNATVSGTLGVTGNTSLSTLSTSGTATLNAADITNNATVGGTLAVTGQTTTSGIDNSNGGITNAGAISGVTGLTGEGTGNISGFVDVTASGTIQGGTLSDGAGTTISGGTVTTTTISAGTGNITTVNATTANVATVNSTTIVNAGATSTNSLSVGTGGVSVAPGASVSVGGNRVQNVATPVNATDAANKAYVDSVSGNVDNLESQIDKQSARIDSAFVEIDRNTEGIAVAMAMGGLALPPGKEFAIGANIGFFQDKQAAAAQTVIRVDDKFTLNGGVGVGLGYHQVGGRVGMMAAW